jgi:paraquat-inducible protein A
MDINIVCTTCGLAQRVGILKPGMVAQCCRCAALICEHKVSSVENAVALALAALILYVPANIYPILRFNLHGAYSESTIWDGCVSLVKSDQWLVAAIVFFASILIPMFKLLGLFYLAITAQTNSLRNRQERTWIYRFIVVIGPWAMLDVFLLSVLVALVKLQQLATILPGPGLLAFTAVVVLTILASASFDPKLIWTEPDVTS